MTKKEEECEEEGERKRKGGDMPQNAEVQNLGGGMRAHVQWPLVPDATRNLGAEAPRVHVITRVSLRNPLLLPGSPHACALIYSEMRCLQGTTQPRTMQENDREKAGQGPLSAYPCRA